jgi:hypothetical protein
MTATGGSYGDRTPVCGEMHGLPVSPPVRPDILILMDRSSSLLDDATGTSCTGGCGGSSKWALLTTAVEKLVVGIGSVNWGLMFFGTDDACGVNPAPVVPVSDNPASAMSIFSALGAQTPGGEAPTTAAVSAAVQYLVSVSDGSPKYLLLVTDGKSGCSSDPEAANFSFPTFVLAAVAPSDTTAIAALNQMAVNGGEPQVGGANAFYTTTDDLFTVLDPAATGRGSCVIPLAGPLQPGMTLAITILVSDGSGMMIPQDATNGWEFTDASETSIVFNGTACGSLENGSYSQITITYLCEYPAGLVQGHSRPVASSPISTSPSATR